MCICSCQSLNLSLPLTLFIVNYNWVCKDCESACFVSVCFPWLSRIHVSVTPSGISPSLYDFLHFWMITTRSSHPAYTRHDSILLDGWVVFQWRRAEAVFTVLSMDVLVDSGSRATVNRTALETRRSNKSILKEISPECSMEGLMLKLKLQYFGHLMWRADSLEKTLMLGKIEGRRRRGRQRMRWLDGVTKSVVMSLSKTLGVGDGQGGLACCSPWGFKESDTTERLNWTKRALSPEVG